MLPQQGLFGFMQPPSPSFVHSPLVVGAAVGLVASSSHRTAPATLVFPAAHLVQYELPALAEYIPAAQSLHWLAFDCSEYLPAMQGLHDVALFSVPVSVIEPAAQVLQNTLPVFDWYFPASHAVHAVAPAVAEK